MPHESKCHLWEADGSLSRSPAALAAMRERLEAEIGSRVSSLAPCLQQWGQGGGLHFSGCWRTTGTPVLAKVGVSANELYWTTHVAAAAPDLVPRLYATGDCLDGMPLAWAVQEQIPFSPLGPLWQGQEFEMTLEAGVRFQQVAATIPAGDTPTVNAAVLCSWLAEGLPQRPPGPVEQVTARAEQDFAWVTEVIGQDVCHHDLHLCNVATRTPPPHRSRALLLDVAGIIQPWAFDAAYLEVLNSVEEERRGNTGLVRKMALLRQRYGLSTCAEADLPRLSAVVLAWFAIRQWSRNPQRRAIPSGVESVRRYVVQSAAA